MTSPLRGAVAGFGRMGMTHFSILNCHPTVDFVSICDPSSFIRNKVKDHLGIDTFNDHDEMIRESSPDFVIIATPTGTHTNCALEAIANGVHIFMEKPLAVSPDDGASILRELENTHIVNQVGYVLRFNDIFMAIKGLLSDHILDDVINFKVEVRSPTILRDVKEGWRAKKSQGGGCLHDFASHAVDLINYLFGPPIKISGSNLQRIYSAAVDDAVYSTMEFQSGMIGTLHANWSDPSYRKPTYNVDILCRGGRIVADLHQFKIFFRDEPTQDKYRKGWNTVYVTDIAEPVRFYLRGYEFTRQLDYFIDKIQSADLENLSSFKDANTTDNIIQQIATRADSEKGL